MEINPRKCGIMSYNAVYDDPIIKIDQYTLPCVDSYTYLGVIFNKNLNFLDHIKYRKRLANNAVKKMSQFLQNQKIQILFKKRVISAVIVPIVSFDIELTGMDTARIKEIEIPVTLAARTIVKASKGSSTNALLNELDIQRMSLRAAIMRLRTFHKWQKSGIFVKNIFSKISNQKRTWFTSTKYWLKRKGI